MQANPWTRVVMLAAVAIGGVMAWRAWQRRRLARADRSSSDRDRATGLARTVGVAGIDPAPITQVAGEGIDLDASPTRPTRVDDAIGEDVRDRSSTLHN